MNCVKLLWIPEKNPAKHRAKSLKLAARTQYVQKKINEIVKLRYNGCSFETFRTAGGRLNNRIRRQGILLGMILILAVVVMVKGLFGKPNDKLRIGEAAPDFTLTDRNGDQQRLSDYRGRFVVVNFWGTFCPPCREETPVLIRQYAEWKGQAVEMLGVNLQADNETAVERFVARYSIPYPILADRDDKARELYRVTEYPTTFFINPQGIITEIKVGAMDESFIRKALAEGLSIP